MTRDGELLRLSRQTDRELLLLGLAGDGAAVRGAQQRAKVEQQQRQLGQGWCVSYAMLQGTR